MKTFQKLSLIAASIFMIAGLMPIRSEAAAIVSTPYVTVPACANLTVTLRYGDRDNAKVGEVSVLQNFLHDNNYLSVTATGYFGPLTLSAVKNFQAANGLQADGIVGVQTRAHILAKNAQCYQNPAPVATPVINSITPVAGPAGTTVTVIGGNFTDTGNIVHVSGGAVSNIASSNDGMMLTFTMPNAIGPYCKAGQACPMYEQLLTPGTYPVYIENANGTSNTVTFTVI